MVIILLVLLNYILQLEIYVLKADKFKLLEYIYYSNLITEENKEKLSKFIDKEKELIRKRASCQIPYQTQIIDQENPFRSKNTNFVDNTAAPTSDEKRSFHLDRYFRVSFLKFSLKTNKNFI